MVLDHRAFDWYHGYQRGVLSRSQAVAYGLSPDALRHRIRAGGPWQRLLPGVYLTATGQPTQEQLLIASMVYAGPDGLVSGPAALANYRIRGPETRMVDVLVPVTCKRSDSGFVLVHRTRRIPTTVIHDGAIRYALAERAVADTVRWMPGSDLAAIRAAVASAVQQGRCTIADLVAELQAGPIRGSAAMRKVLAEVIDGIRSPAEADLRTLIRRSAVPQPLYNPKLYLPGGVFLAQPDAWWPDHGVVAEVDSREWHLLPADWEDTMARHARMSAAGIVVLHFSPRQMREKPEDVIGLIVGAVNAGRLLPAITTRPLAA
ncbi:MAG: hypothetical protein J2P29_07645 [Actinobacteria bacterium]|nr:hypothetical protein [Actinomycetota bacterium]